MSARVATPPMQESRAASMPSGATTGLRPAAPALGSQRHVRRRSCLRWRTCSSVIKRRSTPERPSGCAMAQSCCSGVSMTVIFLTRTPLLGRPGLRGGRLEISSIVSHFSRIFMN